MHRDDSFRVQIQMLRAVRVRPPAPVLSCPRLGVLCQETVFNIVAEAPSTMQHVPIGKRVLRGRRYGRDGSGTEA
ncbi:hypothetical protein EYF80_038064 [Liparis tanakae]|uniref:Uncharacterized protein n=1 Tax=Liparis tanakae TaxID=230148 RepID=A0A4Z2GG48_9TELE|nr:hypothetical protein EYF80_038064 [Liparis tanakae]